ncbi:hypothetical protein D3C81_1296070 [compost metagenome]
MSSTEVRTGWVITPVPELPLPDVAVSGAAKASRLASVSTTSISAEALRVGVILKLSPTAAVPLLRSMLKPSITGAGSSLVL